MFMFSFFPDMDIAQKLDSKVKGSLHFLIFDLWCVWCLLLTHLGGYLEQKRPEVRIQSVCPCCVRCFLTVAVPVSFCNVLSAAYVFRTVTLKFSSAKSRVQSPPWTARLIPWC